MITKLVNKSRVNSYSKVVVFIIFIFFQNFLFYRINELPMYFFFYSSILNIGIMTILFNKRKILLFLFSLVYSFIFMGQSMHYINFSKFAAISDLGKLKYIAPVMDVTIKSFRPVFLLYFIPTIIIVFFMINKNKCLSISKLKRIYIGVFFISIYLVSITVYYPMSQSEIVFYHAKQLHYEEPEIAIEIPRKAGNIENRSYSEIAKGRNLINIQVESLSSFVIDLKYNGQEITPNLNKLIKENSIYMDNYYQMIGNGHTSDAEFVINNSLYPTEDGPMYQNYYEREYYGLPWILKENGYSSYVFHGYEKTFWNRNKAYPNQGYDKFYSEEYYKRDKNLDIGFGIRDKEFLIQTADKMKEIEKPFYGFVITLTSHVPFEMPEDLKKINLLEEDKDTVLGNYLQSIHYTDEAIGAFISKLKQNDLYNNSLITIYGDHYAIDGTDESNQKIMSRFIKRDYDVFEMMHIPMIIHIPNKIEAKKISCACSHIDYTPTILNILGINRAGCFFGEDMLNTENGFVALQGLYNRGSFVEGKTGYIASRDFLFESGKCIDIENHKNIDLINAKDGFDRAIREASVSDLVVRKNLIRENIKKTGNEYGEIISKSLNFPKSLFNYENIKECKEKSVFVSFTSKENDFTTLFCNQKESIYDLNSKEFNYAVIDLRESLGKLLDIVSTFESKDFDKYIPQIYKMEQFSYVNGLGFNNIILNFNQKNYEFSEICDFINVVRDISNIAVLLENEDKQTIEQYKKLDIPIYLNKDDIKENIVYELIN